MPTYQYACTNPDGKHQFEVVQSFTDAPVSECPECGSPVRKVYGSVGVKFRGHELMGVSVRLTLWGPRRWRAKGRGQFTILFWDVMRERVDKLSGVELCTDGEWVPRLTRQQLYAD